MRGKVFAGVLWGKGADLLLVLAREEAGTGKGRGARKRRDQTVDALILALRMA